MCSDNAGYSPVRRLSRLPKRMKPFVLQPHRNQKMISFTSDWSLNFVDWIRLYWLASQDTRPQLPNIWALRLGESEFLLALRNYFHYFKLFYTFECSWAPHKPDKFRYTILRSAFVHKKHRVQYEIRTYFRFVDLYRLTGSTLATYLEYIERNLPEGVALKTTKIEILPLEEHLKKPPPKPELTE